MGCGPCGGKGGYESPALGAYVWGLVMQLSAGCLMLLVGEGSFGYDGVLNALKGPSGFDTRGRAMTSMGSIHITLVAAMAAVLLAGFFISECFLLPLCILSLCQMIYCIVSSGVCGYYWNIENGRRTERLLLDRASRVNQVPIPPILPDTIDGDAGVIYFVAVITLGCLVSYSRASSIDDGTPAPEVALYVPTITMCTCLGALLIIGAPHLKDVRTMGIIWIAISIGLGIIINMANCFCCPKFFNLVVGGCFGVVAAAAIIFGSYFASWYGVGRFTWLGLHTGNLEIKEEFMDPFLAYMFLNLGTGLVAAFLLSMAIGIFAIFSGIYALRSVLCCCGRKGSKDAKKPAPAAAAPAGDEA